jgi:hypothetical protein
MGIGHAAVALGASRIEPRINVGVLIFAALFADFLLWVLVALGVEQVHVPADFAARHYLTFTFPYSHGLVSLLIWGVLLGGMVCWIDRRNRKLAFWVIAALVFSHFLLDALVHVPELPLLGENSPKIGLALWNHLPLELVLETVMAAAGLAIYLRLPGSILNRYGIAGFTILLTGLTWLPLWMAKAPSPSRVNWIFPLLFAVIPYIFDRKRVMAAQSA